MVERSVPDTGRAIGCARAGCGELRHLAGPRHASEPRCTTHILPTPSIPRLRSLLASPLRTRRAQPRLTTVLSPISSAFPISLVATTRLRLRSTRLRAIPSFTFQSITPFFASTPSHFSQSFHSSQLQPPQPIAVLKRLTAVDPSPSHTVHALMERHDPVPRCALRQDSQARRSISDIPRHSDVGYHEYKGQSTSQYHEHFSVRTRLRRTAYASPAIGESKEG